MSLNQRERALRNQRTLDAVAKDLMGPSGKLGLIARYLGSPIIRQGSGMGSYRTMDEYLGEKYDIYQEDSSDQLPTFDEGDSFVELEGYIFDGLSRGMHIEIKYENESHKLMVHYKGFPVYTELAGDLYSYAPFPEWEIMIEKLHRQAEIKFEKNKKSQNAYLEAKAKQEKAGFLQKLRLRWGV